MLDPAAHGSGARRLAGSCELVPGLKLR
jgi:hypothetical protein